jgi:hypothetical protein
MQEADALLTSALRRYITLVVREHADAQQFERAVQRRELTFRVEYEGTTQTVQVTAINRLGEPMVISTRKLGS